MIVVARVLRQIPDPLSDGNAVMQAVHAKDFGAATRRAGESQQEFDGGAFARAVGS